MNKLINDVSMFTSKASGWNTEKEFVDFIESNIEVFTKDVVGMEYRTHKREWYMHQYKNFGGNKPRIDLMIMATNGKRIGIECKRPTQSFAELSRTLSQLLSYAVLAEENCVPFNKLYLLTTQYDDILHKVILKYELPIRVVVFSKDMRAELV